MTEEVTLEGNDICDVCKSKEFERFFSNGYNFMRCEKCGEIYLDD